MDPQIQYERAHERTALPQEAWSQDKIKIRMYNLSFREYVKIKATSAYAYRNEC